MLLVLNLSLADLIFAVVGFSIRGPGMIYHNFYTQNRATVVICKTAMFFYLPILVSINLTVLLLTYDRRCAIRTPLRQGALRSHRGVVKAVVVSWFLSISVCVILVACVQVGIAGETYDEGFGRCSFTTTTGGKVLHFIMYSSFLVAPALLTLTFYAEILVLLSRHQVEERSRSNFTRRHSRVFAKNELKLVGSRVSKKSFVTITIILVFYFLTLLPSYILRDVPMILSLTLSGTTLKLPAAVTVATSVAFYFCTFTDPIVYGMRSPHIFKTVKQMVSYVQGGEGGDRFTSYHSKSNSRTAMHSSCNLSRASSSLGGSTRASSLCSGTSLDWGNRSKTTLNKANTSICFNRTSNPVPSTRTSRDPVLFARKTEVVQVSMLFMALMPVLNKARTTRMRLCRSKTL